jgi:hypothetical protein
MGKLTSWNAGTLPTSWNAGTSPASPHSPRSQGFLVLPLLLLGVILTSSPGFAQALRPSNIPTPPPKTTSSTPTPKQTKQSNVTPSRYISEENLDAYLAFLTTTFSMSKRATDPFGLVQDPNAKPIIKTSVTKQSRRVAPIKATPFAEIIKLIKVTTIMPKDKCFLIGTRSIKQGDRIPLAFRSKNINVEVTLVTSRQIVFLNLENNETAALELNMLPVGMTPGTRGITTPGMAPDRPNAPLELDPAFSLSDKSPNR